MIPSVFKVSDDGLDVEIEGYINGLGPREQHPTLYRALEQIFLLALPHLERVLAFEYKGSGITPSGKSTDKLSTHEVELVFSKLSVGWIDPVHVSKLSRDPNGVTFSRIKLISKPRHSMNRRN